eukprot:TRINITY_DN49499_c0_g1_i1.p1 TRINITY_DN49499_c0_g1~~TRINITY_DN49499_c0_g1_i1.p1  ORF type:complete len:139 (+),score=34.33 TRINITY_DN49499_c0_g1_i1:45-419(+)
MSGDGKGDMPKYLYHYTDKASAEQIKATGVIKKSTGPGDCALGHGTYFTSKPPSTTNKGLLSNNYDGRSKGPDKVESFVKVKADKIPGLVDGRQKLGRDVFKAPGDVKLFDACASTGARVQQTE